ncbi:MAG: type I-E CRISPR-associated protein Cse1/CasA [Candidatus Wallbacteria bacterium]|nr:type I-E CRISPR-associated protein Cse1/CasA [Candidatus Wallbacteria bacterium]
MNLIGDPWIPVIDESNRRIEVGLKELYERSHEFRDLALLPHHRIAVTRLLLCITQAALDGPNDEQDWLECKSRIVSESLKYLEKWKDSFNLYGDKPFLQIKSIERKDNATLDKFDFSLASGNNPTLFDHHAMEEGRNITDTSLAVNLLAYQCFSPGGRIGENTWGGIPTAGNGSSLDGPCVEGEMLFTILKGSDMLDTIHNNLITKNQISSMPNGTWGTPVWERYPCDPNDKLINELSVSYLGRLVPLSRLILLHEKSATLANGIEYKKLPEIREPMSTVFFTRDETAIYLKANPDRHIWRDLNSLLALERRDFIGGGSLQFDHLNSHKDRVACSTVYVWTGGIAKDKGKIEDFCEWNFSVDIAILNKLGRYGEGVEHAHFGESKLKEMISRYAKSISSEAASYRQKAVRFYWHDLDSCHEQLIAHVISGELSSWQEIVKDRIFRAYTYACPRETARQIQAFAVGQREFHKKRRK